MSPLRWTCKSAAKLASELESEGSRAGERSVNRLPHALGYGPRSNRKTIEGGDHPDRNAQFRYINRRVQASQGLGRPAVSVAPKEELVGRSRNGGRGWRPGVVPRR